MKKLLITVLAMVCCILTYRQSNKEDVAMIQAMFGKEKKLLVEDYMTVADDKKNQVLGTL